jgi:hypothetical protein
MLITGMFFFFTLSTLSFTGILLAKIDHDQGLIVYLRYLPVFVNAFKIIYESASRFYFLYVNAQYLPVKSKREYEQDISK